MKVSYIRELTFCSGKFLKKGMGSNVLKLHETCSELKQWILLNILICEWNMYEKFFLV